MTPNPYEPATKIDAVPHASSDFLRVAFGSIAILIGICVFGLGLYAAWRIATMVLMNPATGLSDTMIAVSDMYMLICMSFFLSARFTFRRNARVGGILFAAPFVVFVLLLAVFGT